MTALRAGTFVDLGGWWKVLVRGADAFAWLNDLLTADLDGLDPGRSRRTLLLTPTGRVRADVVATPFEDGILLLQDPRQPSPVADLLSPYVLSSDVQLVDRTGGLGLAAFPGSRPEDLPDPGAGHPLTPSVLGPGADLLGPPDLAERVPERWTPATLDDVERWRIARGAARYPVDLTPDSLPHETPLGDAVAFDKGCYLGQEAVAKVRNLGHPPFVLLAATAGGAAAAGDEVVADGSPVGRVTSAAPGDGGDTAAILRVKWAARHAALSLADGTPIEVRGSASG